ncbi:MAG: ring-cleaving dioxygenase [Bdellovibrionales bacterium]|nr:ring-cleaving dioxygenase [Bdellovibrionales bacterium]
MNEVLQVRGFHHVTAVTADPVANYRFYTDLLGLRLVKKTVNQDDVSAYHLFYADGKGSPGTDITFFHWALPRAQRGTDSIVRTGFLVRDSSSIAYWRDRLAARGVLLQGEPRERDGRLALDFEDFEGQRLSIIAAEDDLLGEPWANGPVPAAHQLRGLAAMTVSVADLDSTAEVLTQVLSMRRCREYEAPDAVGETRTAHVFAMSGTGPAAELHVIAEPDLPRARLGAGGVHHVALRLERDEEYAAWESRLRSLRMPSSGPIDRFYFRSIYFRLPSRVLFELATDEPGFDVDEELANLGTRLALPPFLEDQREAIERGLPPLTLAS